MNRSKSIAAVATLLGFSMTMPAAHGAQYTKQEQEAIAAVQGFYDALNARDAAGGESKMPIRPIVEKYIAPNYHQNSPALAAAGQGPEALIRMFQGMGGPGGPPGAAPPGAGAPPAGGPPPGAPGPGGPPREAAKVVYIGAVGNVVVRVSGRGTSDLIFNMFTVENGKLVEHWDAAMGGGMGRGGGAGGPPPGAPPPSAR